MQCLTTFELTILNTLTTEGDLVNSTLLLVSHSVRASDALVEQQLTRLQCMQKCAELQHMYRHAIIPPVVLVGHSH